MLAGTQIRSNNKILKLMTARLKLDHNVKAISHVYNQRLDCYLFNPFFGLLRSHYQHDLFLMSDCLLEGNLSNASRCYFVKDMVCKARRCKSITRWER